MHETRRLISEFGNQLKDDFKFFKQWVSNPGAVGSIKPTSKRAASAMANLLPIEKGLPVLELGPGTGALTRQILARGVAPKDLVSVEYSAEFCTYLLEQFPGVKFINGDAFDLPTTLSDMPSQKFCGAISGLPLLNFPKSDRIRLILDALDRVEDNGPFIQMCYGPNPPVAAIPGTLAVEKSVLILRNVPPLRIWVYRKETN